MSPQMGRPKSDKPKSVRYSVRLDQDTEYRLKMYCELHAITRMEAIRRGIDKLLAENKK